MREEVNGAGNMRISTPESPDHSLLGLLLSGEWTRQMPTIISIGWKEAAEGFNAHKVNASFAILGDKHILKFKRFFSLNKGMERSASAVSVVDKPLEITEVTYG